MKRYLAEALVVSLAFFGLVMALHLCNACKSPEQVEPRIIETRAKNAIDLEAYGRALADCRLAGRSARDAGATPVVALDIYESCALAADVKYGVKP